MRAGLTVALLLLPVAHAMDVAQKVLMGGSDGMTKDGKEAYIHHDLRDLVYAAAPVTPGEGKGVMDRTWAAMSPPDGALHDWEFVPYNDLQEHSRSSLSRAKEGDRVLLLTMHTYSSNTLHIDKKLTRGLSAMTDGLLTKVLGATHAMQLRTLIRKKNCKPNCDPSQWAIVLLDGRISGAIYTLAAKMLYFSDKADMSVDKDVCKLCNDKSATHKNKQWKRASPKLGSCNDGEDVQYGVKVRSGRWQVFADCDPMFKVPKAEAVSQDVNKDSPIEKVLLARKWFFARGLTAYKGSSAFKLSTGQVVVDEKAGKPFQAAGKANLCSDKRKLDNVDLLKTFCKLTKGKEADLFYKDHASAKFYALKEVVHKQA